MSQPAWEPPTIASVRQALEAAGVPYVIDESARKLCSSRTLEGHMTLITSRSALRAYDAQHPERLVCILRKTSGDYYVVVNNRELDLRAAITRFLDFTTQALLKTLECCVCYARPKTFTLCSSCRATMCRCCLSKIDAKDLPGNSMQCPVCRQWNLDGEGFGTPWNTLQTSLPTNPPYPDRGAGAQLSWLMTRLDGEVFVALRADRTFEVDNTFVLTRLPGAMDRYACGSMKPSGARKRLEAFIREYGPRCTQLRLYISRVTFAIDRTANRPIEEISAFNVRRDGSELLQLAPDAWIDVLEREEGTTTRVKVQYTRPHTFVLPEVAMRLFADINALRACQKTVALSFADASHGGIGMNFDVSKSGEMETMKPAMATEALGVMLETGHRLLVTVRLHCGVRASDMAAYWLDSSGYERLNASCCRAEHDRNMDRLRGKRVIRRFV